MNSPVATHGQDIKRFTAKGHDSSLQEAQINRQETTVVLMSGESVTGRIARRDRYTITIARGNGHPDMIIFKHAIESVSIDRNVKVA